MLKQGKNVENNSSTTKSIFSTLAKAAPTLITAGVGSAATYLFSEKNKQDCANSLLGLLHTITTGNFTVDNLPIDINMSPEIWAAINMAPNTYGNFCGDSTRTYLGQISLIATGLVALLSSLYIINKKLDALTKTTQNTLNIQSESPEESPLLESATGIHGMKP